MQDIPLAPKIDLASIDLWQYTTQVFCSAKDGVNKDI